MANRFLRIKKKQTGLMNVVCLVEGDGMAYHGFLKPAETTLLKEYINNCKTIRMDHKSKQSISAI